MFIDNFERICKIKGLKPTPTLNDCGISPATATNWTKKRNVIPDGKTIVKLADHLDVSTDFLLLGKETALTDEQQTMLNIFNQLSETSRAKLMERAEVLLENEKSD